MRSRFLRWSLRALLALGLLLLAALALAWWYLRGSLPLLDGQLAVAGLSAPVRIERDALGVPTITGSDRADVAFATGFAHAQDRYFQMDLLRRTGAGELAELFGAPALPTDRRNRQHRFRARAAAALAALPAADRALLQRYADGVNAGLSALGRMPFEYTVLRMEPERWDAQDTLLVVWTLYLDLQGEVRGRELARGWLRDHASPDALAFLLPEMTDYDAPLDGQELSRQPAMPAQAPDWFARPVPAATGTAVAAQEGVYFAGSNSWAIAGSRTRRQEGAIVADDMHLSLRLPNIWYRAQLRFADKDGTQRRITGVTLPGTPLVIVGSNGDVAWSLSNSAGDYLDLVRIERDPADPLKFKGPGGSRTAVEYRETLKVHGAASETMPLLQIDDAPVVQAGEDFYLERWVAHQAGAVDLTLLGLESARTAGEALDVASRAGFPAQNFTAGDRAGHIGWTIGGAMPDRDWDTSDTFPLSATEGERQQAAWTKLRAPGTHPRLMDPALGQLWTSNNRQLGGEAYRAIGDGGADMGARARQVRDFLVILGPRMEESGSSEVQLDDRAVFMAAWRDRALRVLDEAALQDHPERRRMRELLVGSWTGRASADSQAYRLSRLFLYAAYAEMFAGVDADLGKLDRRASYATANMRWPAVLGQLLDDKPPGWLPASKRWREVELAIVDRAIQWAHEDAGSLDKATWGARNAAKIQHPMAPFLPGLGRFLSAPPDQLPGDDHMPRVASATFGAAQRMVVTPGHEQDGILNMPGGQSGHPLSPYFLAGHSDWVEGRATPFLPGPAVHSFSLAPR